MITISDKTLCCGCSACVSACPAQCIVMRRDREGFDYPVINSPDLCVECGKCEKVCPVLSPLEKAEPMAAFAARSHEYIDGSSSGGVFPALAEHILSEGGVVFGAVVNDDMTVGHAEAYDMAGVEKMRGSKYVQSDLYASYEDVRYWLQEGRKVLFTGTPCQVAGLHKYLGKPYDGLVTVDVLCHGVPSPGLWEKYVKALEHQHGAKMEYVCFKDKSESWRHYAFTTSFGSCQYIDDPYMALFVQDMTLRPSCYKCAARDGRSGSDVTLSDLWSVQVSAPDMNDDRGVSGVYVYTEKGSQLMEAIAAKVEIRSVDMAQSRMDNGGFHDPAAMSEKREEFFKGVHSTKDIIKHMKAYVVRKPLWVRAYRSVRRFLSTCKKKILK